MNTGTDQEPMDNQSPSVRSRPHTEPGHKQHGNQVYAARLQHDTGRATAHLTPTYDVPAPTNLSSPINATERVTSITCSACDVTVTAWPGSVGPIRQMYEHWATHHNPKLQTRRYDCE